MVDRKDYTKLYKAAVSASKQQDLVAYYEPMLLSSVKQRIWDNTIGFLESDNFKIAKQLGGKIKRGLLLHGAPGNGKTSTLRWLMGECRKRGLEVKIVTHDAYKRARSQNDPDVALSNLFSTVRKGLIIFDDMDIALRDREKGYENENQNIFLTALDGIKPKEGTIFVFTTNCGLSLIDTAFKRPGRIDVIVELKPPDETLRRKFINGWHREILNNVDVNLIIAEAKGYSFAELDEVKALLIQGFANSGTWSAAEALNTFDKNRGVIKKTRSLADVFNPSKQDVEDDE